MAEERVETESMPLTERRMRYEAMMQKITERSIQRWFADFIDALHDTQVDAVTDAPLASDAAALWPMRSAAAGYH